MTYPVIETGMHGLISKSELIYKLETVCFATKLTGQKIARECFDHSTLTCLEIQAF